jgi:hypothetical protein
MPGERGDERSGEAPRTDLPAEREPYYDGYFGTDEEEGVERERDAGDGEGEERRAPSREAAEDSAGGDRGIL